MRKPEQTYEQWCWEQVEKFLEEKVRAWKKEATQPPFEVKMEGDAEKGLITAHCLVRRGLLPGDRE